MEKLRLWTIQTTAAWEKAEATGILKADGRRVNKYFRPAYQWLMEQMTARLPNYEGGYPIWAWVQPKPDLRSSSLLAKGTSGVRVEFISYADKVLITDFDAWHTVLNRDYLSLSEEDYNNFWQNYEIAKQNGNLDYIREQLEASWSRLFGFEDLKPDPDW